MSGTYHPQLIIFLNYNKITKIVNFRLNIKFRPNTNTNLIKKLCENYYNGALDIENFLGNCHFLYNMISIMYNFFLLLLLLIFLFLLYLTDQLFTIFIIFLQFD